LPRGYGGRRCATASPLIVALVLLLASIGLYGVVALAVGQRRREIGVRMALGARAAAVVGLFYRDGVKLAALGVAIGLPLSLIGARVLDNATDVRPFERANMLVVGGVVLAVVFVVASIATLIPSRRAAAVDPVAALQSE